MAIKHTKLLAAFLAAVIFGATAVAFSAPVAAESGTAGTVHLQVSPVKQKLALEPGESYVSSFKVMNIGTGQFSYSASVTPYKVINEDGSASYSEKSNYSMISDWVVFDEEKRTGTLEAGASVEIPFTITVPKDAPAGGQYAAIMAETSDGNEVGASVQAVNRVGMILYASVAGETRLEGNVLENNINHFMFDPPISVSSLVENTGNVEATVTYTVKIWPFFGGDETVYNNEERPSTVDVMPESRRYSSVTWEGSPKLGAFWVEQTINYPGQPASSVKKLVVICPLWFLFLIFAVIFALIVWLISRAVSRQRAKKQPAKDRGTASAAPAQSAPEKPAAGKPAQNQKGEKND